MFIVPNEGLGRGDEDLGRQLMAKFVRQLSLLEVKPDVLAFYNAGVKLLANGSPLLEALRALEDAGVELIVCGTCVEYYRLHDSLGAGRISDMRDIVATMAAAEKVITV